MSQSNSKTVSVRQYWPAGTLTDGPLFWLVQFPSDGDLGIIPRSWRTGTSTCVYPTDIHNQKDRRSRVICGFPPAVTDTSSKWWKHHEIFLLFGMDDYDQLFDQLQLRMHDNGHVIDKVVESFVIEKKSARFNIRPNTPLIKRTSGENMQKSTGTKLGPIDVDSMHANDALDEDNPKKCQRHGRNDDEEKPCLHEVKMVSERAAHTDEEEADDSDDNIPTEELFPNLCHQRNPGGKKCQTHGRNDEEEKPCLHEVRMNSKRADVTDEKEVDESEHYDDGLSDD